MTWKDCFTLLLILLVCTLPVLIYCQQEYEDEQFFSNQHSLSLSPKNTAIYELMEELRETYLVQELQLSEERAVAVVKTIRAAKSARKKYALQRYIIENELYTLLDASPSNQSKISDSLQKLEHSRLQYYQEFVGCEQDIRQLLNPQEQAKYILFQREFNQKLRDIIATIRQKHDCLSVPHQLLRKKFSEAVIRRFE